MRTLFACLATAAATLFALPDPVKPDPNSPRPIEAVDSVFIEDLTWMEVRDRMRDGVDTVLIATGGVEQNGPYIVTGKHNFVLRGASERIARKLGNTLVAPIVAFVPEGDIDPPSLHMKYPGSISLREETFQALLTDLCASFKTTGFKRIVLLGDSGGNQPGMKAVAEKLNSAWGGAPRIVYVPEFYDYAGLTKWVEAQGIRQQPEGLHDDFVMSAQLLAIDPATIRMQQRIKAGNFRINGVDLAPAETTIAWGRKILDYRADQTVAVIRAK
ncbi:MAG: creatininase family protein [Planctomycetia bacterium]|nr:creatininase family protein [Planctomycetia bacterium]